LFDCCSRSISKLTPPTQNHGGGVHLRRVNEIALGRRGISADTALRFARFFGTSPEVWQNLQSQYEMDIAKNSIWEDIKATIKPALGRVACL